MGRMEQRRRRALLSLVCLLCLAVLSAPVPCVGRFSYKHFGDVSYLNLVGSAKVNGREKVKPTTDEAASPVPTSALQPCIALTHSEESDMSAAPLASPSRNPAQGTNAHSASATSHSGQVGAVWYERPIELRHRHESTASDSKDRKQQWGPEGFVTSFQFRLTPTIPFNHSLQHAQNKDAASDAGHTVNDAHASGDDTLALASAATLPNTGGGGIAFVLQSAGNTAMGRSDSGIGYASLPGVLAVEFDTEMNMEERDPNANHVSVHVSMDGKSDHGSTLSAFESEDGRVVALSYDQLPLRRPRIVTRVNNNKKNPSNESRPPDAPTSSPPAADTASSSSSSAFTVTPPSLIRVQVSYRPALASIKVFVEDLVTPVLEVKNVPSMEGAFFIGFTGSARAPTPDTQEICNWIFQKQSTPLSGASAVAASAAMDEARARGDEEGVKVAAANLAQSLASSKANTFDDCDSGFSGPSCTLDLSSLARECLFQTSGGCRACLAHPSGHCRWCGAQNRCISDLAALTAEPPDTTGQRGHKPYCTDLHSIVEEEASCVETRSFAIWFISIGLLIVVISSTIALTGSVWKRARKRHTMKQDILQLGVYTILGSILSAGVTALVNVALTELTTSPESFATALGICLLLFTMLLMRDMWMVRRVALEDENVCGMGHGIGRRARVTTRTYSYAANAEDQDAMGEEDDDTGALLAGHSHAHVSSSSPTSSERCCSCCPRLLHRCCPTMAFRWLFGGGCILLVPSFYICTLTTATIGCFSWMSSTDWSAALNGWQRAGSYLSLSLSMCFTVAYVILAAWRVGKIIILAAVRNGRRIWEQRKMKADRKREKEHRPYMGINSEYGGMDADASDPSIPESTLCHQLSHLASSSPVRGATETRIMAAGCFVSGLYFGTMFSQLDGEDPSRSHLDVLVQQSNYFTYPLAACLGAMSTFTNQYLALWKLDNGIQPIASAASKHQRQQYPYVDKLMDSDTEDEAEATYRGSNIPDDL